MEKLKYIKVSYHRREEAYKILDYSDVEPAFLQKSTNLRKVRQEAIDKALNLTGPSPVFQSLLHLMKIFSAIREENGEI